MPKRKCFKSSCRTYIDFNQKYCSVHQGLDQRQYNQTVRQNEYNKQYTNFYNSKSWRKLSKHKKHLDPLCEHCLKKGIIKQGQHIDHIIELKDDWSRRLDILNLQNLCIPCHNKKTKNPYDNQN